MSDFDLLLEALLNQRFIDDSSAYHSVYHAIAWSPDGSTLVSGGENGDIHIWNSETGEHLNKVSSCCGGIWSLDFSPDGRFLVCGGLNGTAQVFNAENGYQPYVVLLPLLGAGEPGITINPFGEYKGRPGIEEYLVCVIQTEDGQKLLSVKEFASKYGWINEP